VFVVRLAGYLLGAISGLIQAGSLTVPLILKTGQGTNSFTLIKSTAIRVQATGLALAMGGLALMGKLKRPGLLWPVLAYAGSWVLSTIFSSNRKLSFYGGFLRSDGLWTLACNLLAYLGSSQLDAAGRRKTENAILLAGGGMAGYALVQKAKRDWISWQQSDRPGSTSGNPDFLAQYLGMVLPLAIPRLLAPAPIEQRLGWIAYIAGLLAAIGVSKTRGAILGLAGGLLGYALKGGTKRRYLWLIAATLVPLVVSRAPFIAPLWRGMRQRTNVWRDAIKTWRQRPIFGWGNDAIRSPMTKNKSLATIKGEPATSFDRTHNAYLDELVMRGIVGLATFAGLMWKFYSMTENPAHAGAMGAYLAHNIVSFPSPETEHLAWTLLGLAGQKEEK
jgi:hypothetical protein